MFAYTEAIWLVVNPLMRLALFTALRRVALVSISGVAVLMVSSTAPHGSVRYGMLGEMPVLANNALWYVESSVGAVGSPASTSVISAIGPDETCGIVRIVDSLAYGDVGALFCSRNRAWLLTSVVKVVWLSADHGTL